jgi:hypothetical protein
LTKPARRGTLRGTTTGEQTMRIQAIEYNANTDIVAEEKFATAKEAREWCETRRGAKMWWGDTEFGYQGSTEEERTTGKWPPAKWYEIHGVTEEGDVDYLEESDHEAFGE